MTPSEAGTRGAYAVLAKYGLHFYAAMGRKGGASTRTKGHAHYAALGKMGNDAIKQKYGPTFYKRLSRLGLTARWGTKPPSST